MPKTAKNWIVETEWLQDHLSSPDLVVLDGSWHLPTAKRDAKAEYLAEHIPGARTAVIPGTRHWMFEQAPQEFCDVVLEFLQA